MTRLRAAVLPGLVLLALEAGGAYVRGSPSSPPPPKFSVATHALSDPGLKEFMEQHLGESFDRWPLREWDYSRLTLAAWYFDPRLDATRQTGRQAQFAEPARVRLQTLAWEIRAGVRSNLLDYVFLEREEALREQLEATHTNLVQSAKLRVSVGFMPREELTRLRLQLDQTRQALIQTRLEKMDSRERLARVLGLPVNALFDIVIKHDLLSGTDQAWNVHDLRRKVLRTRPDLSQALIGYAVAETAVRAEVARRGPHPELPVSCWWDARQNRWAVQVDDWLPVAERRGGAIGRAEDRRVEAAARLLQLQSDILDGLERQAALYRISAEELAGADELAESSRVHYELTKSRYQAGIVAAPELLAARLQWITTRIKQLNAQVRLQKALGALEVVMQVPVEQIHDPGLLTDLRPKPETR